MLSTESILTRLSDIKSKLKPRGKSIRFYIPIMDF